MTFTRWLARGLVATTALGGIFAIALPTSGSWVSKVDDVPEESIHRGSGRLNAHRGLTDAIAYRGSGRFTTDDAAVVTHRGSGRFTTDDAAVATSTTAYRGSGRLEPPPAEPSTVG
ncbi:MAG: hypothetical protein IGR92_10180 [Leptolyngbyaceae cyanobacterium T60_A2020_046]|nr:hypothetical protein [Leptolyngbyaceae cyanobacterium T60_A2020_046]